MARTTDVAIVGGGVIGCSIAYYLSLQGIQSTVLEQRRFASGASGATAGVVGPLWHIDHTSEATFSLGLKSLDLFPTLAAELLEQGIDPEFRQSGLLRVALTPEHLNTLQRDFAWQAELDLDVRWLEPAEAFDLAPGVNPDVVGGVFSPREGYVRGQRLVDSLVQAAARRGSTFVEDVEVTGLETDGQRVTGVRGLTDTVHSGHTILAAGPWTGLARRLIPQRIPVRPVKGQRILLRKTGFLPQFPVHNFGGYVVPQVDGNLLVAATRHEGEFDEKVTADGVAQMLATAVSVFPQLREAEFVAARAGVRPGSPDDIPIIGPVPGWEGLSVASGHDAVGIMLSPGTGQLMADYISTGDARPLEPFSLKRFRL